MAQTFSRFTAGRDTRLRERPDETADSVVMSRRSWIVVLVGASMVFLVAFVVISGTSLLLWTMAVVLGVAAALIHIPIAIVPDRSPAMAPSS